jgi:hypothetical protein
MTPQEQREACKAELQAYWRCRSPKPSFMLGVPEWVFFLIYVPGVIGMTAGHSFMIAAATMATHVIVALTLWVRRRSEISPKATGGSDV